MAHPLNVTSKLFAVGRFVPTMVNVVSSPTVAVFGLIEARDATPVTVIVVVVVLVTPAASLILSMTGYEPPAV